MENNNLEMIEFIGFVIVVILLSDFFAYIYSKRKGDNPYDWFK